MTVFQASQDFTPSEQVPSSGRRSLLRQVGISATGVAVFAMTFFRPAPASATTTVYCCDLAKSPTNCNCPSGYSLKVWYCYWPYGGWVFACGECTTGTDCEHGTFNRSCFWRA